MLFFTAEFLVLFTLFMCLYSFLSPKNRVFLVLIASYVFYGWWDVRFLFLLITSTLVDFYVGKAFQKYENLSQRRMILSISVLTNLGMLGFFKYYNFFIDTFVDAFGLSSNEALYVSVLLPPGISFYTFQTLAYSIDVYKKRTLPENDLPTFAAFVAFFPQLIAGPIERSNYLIPQLKKLGNINLAFIFWVVISG